MPCPLCRGKDLQDARQPGIHALPRNASPALIEAVEACVAQREREALSDAPPPRPTSGVQAPMFGRQKDPS